MDRLQSLRNIVQRHVRSTEHLKYIDMSNLTEIVFM